MKTLDDFSDNLKLHIKREILKYDMSNELNSLLNQPQLKYLTVSRTIEKHAPNYNKFITTIENCEGLGNQVFYIFF